MIEHNFSQQDLHEIAGSKGEKLWEKKLDQLINLSPPTLKDELWRTVSFAPKLTFEKNQVSKIAEANEVHIVDGQIASLPKNTEGLVFSTGSQALEKIISEKIPETEDYYELLTEVACQQVLFVEILSSKEIQQTIRIKYDFSNKTSRAFLVYVKAGHHSQARFLETINGQEEIESFSRAIVSLDEGAKVDWIKTHSGNHQSHSFGSFYSKLKRNALLRHFLFHAGQEWGREQTKVELNEEGARVESYGAYLTSGSENVQYLSEIQHKAPHTESVQLYKGILDENSQVLFRGMIEVDQVAQQSQSEQLNKNIVLSKKATINTRPQLKISADDVKCAHGATIGQLDEEQVFYLRTRGFSDESSRFLLTQGHILEILLKIGDKDIQDKLEKQLWDQFNK